MIPRNDARLAADTSQAVRASEARLLRHRLDQPKQVIGQTHAVVRVPHSAQSPGDRLGNVVSEHMHFIGRVDMVDARP